MRVVKLRIANLERDALSLQPILQSIETMLGKRMLWTFGAHDEAQGSDSARSDLVLSQRYAPHSQRRRRKRLLSFV